MAFSFNKTERLDDGGGSSLSLVAVSLDVDVDKEEDFRIGDFVEGSSLS